LTIRNQRHGSYFIDQKLKNGLLLYINDIRSENLRTAIVVICVQADSHSFDIRPQWIFPATDQAKFVLDRVVEEAETTIINISQV
jgi:hypothetical protein